ncbi:MAG: response regulator [Chloroflexi bacterium]|nr:response regulator [Chloroflexota bacterium]
MSTDKFQTYIALVVEDDASGLAILSVMLRRIGVRTVMERYASDAVDRAKKMTKVDMIFLDLGLPDGDGYEVLAQLKKVPGLKNVPIIAVTARDASTEIARAQAAGFNGFLGKPLNRNRFPDQIRRIMDGEGVWEVYN